MTLAINFNQVSIWQYVDNSIKLNLNDETVIIHHDGKWSLKKFEEGKKTYMMNTLYENDSIFDFCYWLNSKEITRNC